MKALSFHAGHTADTPNADTPNFDSLAKPYRWLEWLTFGPCLHRCRLHYLASLTTAQNALVLGDGDGRFTAALFRANPQIQVTAVDASPRMLKSLQHEAAANADRLTTQVADIRAWQPGSSTRYDLIVSHFFLDCLSTADISRLANRLAPALAPGARWVISDFAIPQSLFGRLVAAPLVAFLYRVFRFLTGLQRRSLPSYSAAIAAAGWLRQSRHSHLAGLLFSELWQRPEACGLKLSLNDLSRFDKNLRNLRFTARKPLRIPHFRDYD